MKKENLQTRQDRIKIVNQIIEEISKHDRRFFFMQKTGRTASIKQKGTKLYYVSEWTGEDICLSVPSYRKPKHWFHGGTLMGLVRDFCLFIRTGKKSNGENGYGGLYCPHWGYAEGSMKKIQEYAVSLGYL